MVGGDDASYPIRHYFMIHKYHFVITTLYKRNLVTKYAPVPETCALSAHTHHTHRTHTQPNT